MLLFCNVFKYNFSSSVVVIMDLKNILKLTQKILFTVQLEDGNICVFLSNGTILVLSDKCDQVGHFFIDPSKYSLALCAIVTCSGKICVGMSNGNVLIIDSSNYEIDLELEAYTLGKVLSVINLDSDGLIAVGNEYGVLKGFNISTHECVFQLNCHAGISSIFKLSEISFLIGGSDGSLKKLNTSSGGITEIGSRESSAIVSIFQNENGNVLCCTRGSVKFYLNAIDFELLNRFDLVSAFFFRNIDNSFLAITADSCLYRITHEDVQHISKLETYRAKVRFLEILSNGSLLVVIDDNTLSLITFH